MKIPKPKLKLIHSGLILVSVPMIFGLIMTLGLNSALQKSWQVRRTIERTATASTSINKLVGDLLEFKADLMKVRYLKNQGSTGRLNIEAKQARAELNSLTDLTATHAEYRQQLKEIVPAAERTLALLERSEDPSIEPEFDSSIENLRTLAETHARLLPLDSSARQHDQSILAWLLAANFLICPLFVLYFSQNFVRRLYVLIANTERLAQQKELLEPIKGTDEIAHLDSVFRSMAETLTRARAEREEVAQLKQDFIAMISHDLRTPLSAVQGTLTLIADGVYGDISDCGVNKARVAEESIARLSNLANELLDIERLESHKLPMELKATGLQSAIQQSIDSVNGFALYKKISIQFPDTDLIVTANEERLIQVIVNLLSNAMKFSPDGSTVSVSAMTVDGALAEVRVTDQGRGISTDMSDVIFDRFRQVEKTDAVNERGMGLGLAICKAIIDGHNGQIGVDSKEGHGCSFWFRLPVAKQKSTLSLKRQEQRLEVK